MVTSLIAEPRASSSNYKFLFLFFMVFAGSFLLFFISNASAGDAPWGASGELDDSYAIRTEGCSIPGLDPFHRSIMKFVYVPKDVKSCSKPDAVPFLSSNATHIWTEVRSLSYLLLSILHYYNLTNGAKFTCCYRGFYRPKSIEGIGYRDIDKRVKYEPCVNFQTAVKVSHEFVSVVCVVGQTSFYKDYFAFTPLKNFDKNDTAAAFNVIVMGIDAVSRMNFHRTMPRTLDYLRKQDAIELLGYNKVGDNTFPNLVPLMMGFSVEELKKTCYPQTASTFDNCQFVWNWYKEAGFVTAFAEDTAFNLRNRFGFGSSPTDYYLHTFMNEAHKHNQKHFYRTIKNRLQAKTYALLCMGSRYYYQVLLDYVRSLADTLKSSKLFGFFWEATVSHDYLNYPMLMDESYERFFKSMKELGHLDRTVLILMSDHGMRYGNIRQTKQGRLEERLPFVYLMMPRRFREKYELAYDNLRANSRRLTTPFDLHETLLDLKDLSSVGNERIVRRMQDSYAGERGISLFLLVPGNRSCETARIDAHWCTCHKSRKLASNDAVAAEGVAYLIRWLNALLKGHRECAQLKLGAVLEASEVEMSKSALRNVTHAWRDFTVVVRVVPSGAVLEATVRREHGGQWSLAGDVSRLNLYGDQSACVHDYKLKLYCYCRGVRGRRAGGEGVISPHPPLPEGQGGT